MDEDKLAFIDHHYHKKTKSGDFIKKLLENKFNVDHYWLNKNEKIPEKLTKYKNYFFFQIFPSLKSLNKLKGKNIVWAPMFDSPHYPIGYSSLLWEIVEYYKIKVVSFSKKITDQIRNKKIEYVDLKYFKKSEYVDNNFKKFNIFFWYRNDLKLSNFLKYFNTEDVEKITYLHLDNLKPEIGLPDKFKIDFISKEFMTSDEFTDIMKKHNIFICPRRKEGIGMTQVEALSFGSYLIGNDNATMNEYITNDKIGILINEKTTKILKNNVIDFKKYRNEFNNDGFFTFEENKYLILELYNNQDCKFKENYIKRLKIIINFYIMLFSRLVKKSLIN